MEGQALGGLGGQLPQLPLGGAQDLLLVVLGLRPGVGEDLLGLGLHPGQLLLGRLLDGLLGLGPGLADLLVRAVQLLLGLGELLLVGMGLATAKSAEGIARQPEAEGKIRTMMMLGLVFIETAIIYALLVVILIIFVL